MREALPSSVVFDSPVAGVDPRWKLAGILLAATVVAALQSTYAAIVAFAAAILFARLARLPRAWLARRLTGPVAVLAAFTLPLPFLFMNHSDHWQIGPLWLSAHGVALTVRVWCKALAIIILVLILTGSTRSSETLHAAHALRVPGLIIQLGALSHRYVHLLFSELGRLRVALRVRGFRNRASVHGFRTMGSLTGILLVRGVERAERVSLAMGCRGFDGRFRSLAQFRTRPWDTAVFVAISVVAITIFIYDFTQR